MRHLEVFLSAHTSGTSTHSTWVRRRKLWVFGQERDVQRQVHVSSARVALTPTTNSSSSPSLPILPDVCNTVTLSKLGTLQEGDRKPNSSLPLSVLFCWITRTKSAGFVKLTFPLLLTTTSAPPNSFFCNAATELWIPPHSLTWVCIFLWL